MLFRPAPSLLDPSEPPLLTSPLLANTAQTVLMEMSIDEDLNRATLGGSGRLWYFKVQKRYLTSTLAPSCDSHPPPSQPKHNPSQTCPVPQLLASDEVFTFSRL